MSRQSVIVSAARTPIGSYGGSLKDIPVSDLGAIPIREVVKRSGVSPEVVDYAVLGIVVQAGGGQVAGRTATVKAGLPVTVGSDTLNKACASGMRAVTLADQMIRCGDVDTVIAGGMENMSQTPYLLRGAKWGLRMGHSQIEDSMLADGLLCPHENVHMIVLGSRLARRNEISREDQDRWSLRSQQRAVEAIRAGRFREEIVPVLLPQKKGEPKVFDTDEFPRPDTTLEKLAQLPPAMMADGTVTAGNSPGVNDGGAALLVMSQEKAQSLGLKPLATIVSHTFTAAPTGELDSGVTLAVKRLLEKNRLTPRDIDLFEINEAFAAVTLAVIQNAGLDPERVNVNGGAVALGHPIGASGARILMTLIYELRRQGKQLGVAAICSGQSQGDAVLVKIEA
ncbi:MAG: acetyl-CoA C-acetyltransferase [Candidatus Tectomicrobia bacterium]|uniref:Acetyl-CoA C-acetyltransferase n=1 Tax=Tectimicrobiota bacterium TaxID=2528274 RepID=A0A932CN82_UNCTE|nr:acetyl-CoA C-acetyltransferase [Candidatus Tectomicrobia bacterium]